ncbi:YdeI/OmpD-associated family protein [Emticicia agri]|uniref:DUF1905 domain-containing protein n=1 Tax=Emticicia agri TaxID=2492393 RepID=A0A4Q5LY36_9BACT|nr:YdeI/OmpD-associated family protein [Emticicia agri]RYU94487.1 DUF1905 domain-containing protein [Emticicia agri]
MVTFNTNLQKFEKQGEKTGWTYIVVPATIANQIKPNTRTTYRVRGKLDNYPIKQVALLPMGDGDYIIPINDAMRKGIRKEEGASVEVSLEIDTDEFKISEDLLVCLEDEPKALEFFNSLPPGHQRYFSNWIEGVKSIEIKSKRISQAVWGLSKGMDFGAIIRHFKGKI